jgi:hypothetical protein
MSTNLFIEAAQRAAIPTIISIVTGDPRVFRNFLCNTAAMHLYRGISRDTEALARRLFPKLEHPWHVGAGFAVASIIVWKAAEELDHNLSYFFWGIMGLNSLVRATQNHKQTLSHT